MQKSNLLLVCSFQVGPGFVGPEICCPASNIFLLLSPEIFGWSQIGSNIFWALKYLVGPQIFVFCEL